MKITIDTATDSKEDIRKAVKLLISLAGGIYEQAGKGEINPTPEVTNAMSMFDSVNIPKEEKQVEETTKEVPEIEFY